MTAMSGSSWEGAYLHVKQQCTGSLARNIVTLHCKTYQRVKSCSEKASLMFNISYWNS